MTYSGQHIVDKILYEKCFTQTVFGVARKSWAKGYLHWNSFFVPLESNLMFATEAMFNILLSYLKQ